MLAIDIGSKKVCVAEGRSRKDTVTVTACGEIEYAAPLVSDGKIEDAATLGFLINEIITKQGMKSRKAVVTVNSTAVVAREFQLPNVKLPRLHLLVQNEMQLVLGSNNGYVVDFTVTGQTDEGLLTVLAFAVPGELVEDYRRLLEQLRLKPHALDLHANAISKLCSEGAINDNPPGEDNIILADVGYAHICFYGFCKGSCQFIRTEASPLRDFIEELGSVFRTDVNTQTMELLDLTPGLTLEDPALVEAIDRFTTRLADEIQRYAQYLLLNSSSKKIAKVYMAGGASQLKGLDAALSLALGIEVQPLQSVAGLKLPAGCSLAKVCNAAGALIRL